MTSTYNKLDFNWICNYYLNNNCKLLIKESEYKGTNTPMPYICSCGNISKNRFNDFQKGGRCVDCKGRFNNKKFKLNFQRILDECKIDGTKCNSTLNDYINEKSILSFTCPKCNLTYFRSWKYFGQKKRRCPECSIKNRSGKNHYNYKVKNRDRKITSKSLSFDLNKINILKDDPNFENYVQSKEKFNKNLIYKNEYSIDHIFPRIAFIDNNLDEIYGVIKIKEICNIRENLRIIHYKENCSKGCKYDQETFLYWFNYHINQYKT